MAILSRILPKEIIVQIFEFAYGTPMENKKRLIAHLNSYRTNFQTTWNMYCYNSENIYKIYNDIPFTRVFPNNVLTISHYTRTDEPLPYEYSYLGDVIEADYPRHQLHLYKRYVRQLEQKIKDLEKKLFLKT